MDDKQSSGKKSSARYVAVLEHYVGQRVDNFLLREIKGLSRSNVYKLLRTGQVRVNKGRVKPDHKLKLDDIIRIPPLPSIKEQRKKNLEGDFSWLTDKIIFENENFMVINKPAGISVHAGSKVTVSVIEALRSLFKSYDYLELVHRLDRDTSGCLLIAKNSSTLKELQAKFKDGTIKKVYLALLKGVINESVDVKVPLKKNVLKSGERIVTVDFDAGKQAYSTFRPVIKSSNATLVKVDLHTGRTHQIRVHSAHIGHPIALDLKYGDKTFNKLVSNFGIKNMVLHSHEISFTLDETYSFTCELSPKLKDQVEQFLL